MVSHLGFNQVKCPAQGQGPAGTSTPLCRLDCEWRVTFPTCQIHPEMIKMKTKDFPSENILRRRKKIPPKKFPKYWLE